MQGQGNYSAPQGNGQYTKAPSFQQYGSLPPPPPPISQGPQQGWPQAGQLRPLVHPSASHGLQSTSNQPYLNSNPPSQMQQHSHWTPNASFNPSSGLPSAPRGLPPPPPLGQTQFGNQVHQQAPPPPYNNTARYYASSPVGSSDPLMPSSCAAIRLPPPPPCLPSSSEGPRILPSSSPSNINSNVLPPTPPKPADDKIARTIELLCQFIAKNGPEFENMTRLKQSENPDFRFLFGAEPGSEAAIAHEYYMWTRRKYQLECNSVAKLGTSNSPLRQSGKSSSHHSSTTDQGLCSSPTDSDMDMEDDITRPLEEPRSFSFEKQDHETVSSSTVLEKKQEFQCTEAGIPKDGVEENQPNLQHSKPGSREQREEKLSAEVDGLGPCSSGDDELPVPVAVSKTVSIHEVLGKPCAPAEIMLETVPNLLPGYESDRNSGGEDQPKTSIPYVGVGSSSHHMDERVRLGKGCETERIAAHKGHVYPAKSSKLSSIVVVAGKDFIAGESQNVADDRYENSESLKDGIPDDGKKKNPKDVSSSLKVDEFGRLIRENDSGSDTDSPRHSRRKRGHSRSRSRSPHDRRRSPRQRNDRRSRSRSFSPKRRRSRSKSPSPTRHVVKTKQRGICFNNANGKHCYRGSSCKYLHPHDEFDRSSPRWGRQQFLDSPRTSGAHKKPEMPWKKSLSEGKNLDRKFYDDSPITEGAAVQISEDGGDLESSVYLNNGDQQHQEVEIPSSFTSQLPNDETHLNDEPVNKTDESGNVSEEPVVHKDSVLPVLDHSASMMPPFFPNLAPSTATFSHYPASYPHSQFSFSPNQPWNSLPPPPPVSYPPRPLPPHGGATGQFAPNMLPQSQGYHYLQDPNRSLGNFDDHQQKTSVASEPVVGQLHVPGMHTSNSFGEGSSLSHNQHMPFLGDSISKRQSYPGEIPPPAGGIYAPQGEHTNQNSSLPVQSSGFDWNLQSTLSNLGVSMIPNHFNPYASTFEQQPSSKLGVTTSSQIHVEGRALPNLSSVQATEGVLPQHGGDQYDPLSDSMEPSLNAGRKSLYGQKHEITDESDGMLRFGGEETMQKMGGAPELSGSFENDEFGETADAEVGAVENGSPNNQLQVNSPGKSKESRSMRLFKIAIANFVKEVLKPSWRQGNMSKEAFKTIVKKTVDRVSGAMKGHQIPKSQSKINHYIDSSQRKLTKLVMGYVDKYVKV